MRRSRARPRRRQTGRLAVGRQLPRAAQRTLWFIVVFATCGVVPARASAAHAYVAAPTGAYTPVGSPDEPPLIVTAAVPNDPLFDQYQWNLRQIQAPDGWDLTLGNSNIVIAILDTGISVSHPDLANRLVPGFDFVNNRDTADDDHGNGTHVAGVAAGDTNNGIGIAGVSWQARLMPVKVLDANAGGDTGQVALGVRWAVDHGARVLNVGLAGPAPSDALRDAVDYARRRGAVVVAPVASSGTGDISYPAASPGVIAVGGTDRADNRLGTSNTGDYISVVAPGDQIASTFRFSNGTNGYAVASTTAQAAAHVSGLAALILAMNPSLQPDEVREIIETSADDLGPPGRDRETGFGRINALRALLYAAPWNFYARGAGSYSATLEPATQLSFPLIMKDVNGWNTGFTVQNTAANPTTLTLDFYGDDGRPVYTFSDNLPARGSRTYDPARLPALPAGFTGAAVARADARLSGVVNEDRVGRDRLTYEAFTAGAETVWVPLLMRQYHGWNTGIQIQNLGGAAGTVRVTFVTRGAAEPLVSSTIAIPPFASRTLYQPTDDRIPQDWVGSGVIESVDGQPLAAIVNQVNGSGPGMSYVGIDAPSARIYAPLLFKNAGGWNTGLQVQNTGSQETTLRAVFAGSEDNDTWSETAAVGAGASTTFYQPSNPQLPDPFVGAGVVASTGDQRLSGVVNEVRAGSTMATAYDVIDRGAETVFAPLVFRGFAGWNSGIQIQNVGTAATTATVRFYGQGGALAATVEGVIDAGESQTYYLPALSGLRSGFVGSAVATSSGEPIAAIVNHVK